MHLMYFVISDQLMNIHLKPVKHTLIFYIITLNGIVGYKKSFQYFVRRTKQNGKLLLTSSEKVFASNCVKLIL